MREPCPNCNKLMVYAHHVSDTWRICCLYCGYGTEFFKTYRQATEAWENLKEKVNDGEG